MAKKPLLSVQDILAEAQQVIKDTKRKICRRCKKPARLVQSGFCEPCQLEIMQEAAERRQNARHIDPETSYVRVYDENDKLVLEHRLVMERLLGRKLKKGEVVLHRNGKNDDNNPSNLMLGFKSGTPFEHLICTNCNSRGTVEYAPEN